jgi:hypothetical protein
MSGNGAYQDEMDKTLDFVDALRAGVPTRLDPRLGAALVPRLAATARAATLEAETHSMREATATTTVAARPHSRRALVARVAIAVALIPLLFAGLAVAGVTVPSPARSAFNAVGIHLPNQPAERSDQGESGPSSQPSTQGTPTQGTATQGTAETGQSAAPSKRKSQAAHEHARAQHEKAKGKALGHERGNAIGLNEATPPGHTGQTGPPAHSNAGGNGGSSPNGNSSTGTPKAPPAPKGVAKGTTTTPPGQSK